MTDDSHDLLIQIRAVLFDSIRDRDCPTRELAPIARRILENEKDILEFDDSPEALRKTLEILETCQSLMKSAMNDDPGFREITALTRRIQITMKEIRTLKEQLRHADKKADDDERPVADESFDPEQL